MGPTAAVTHQGIVVKTVPTYRHVVRLVDVLISRPLPVEKT